MLVLILVLFLWSGVEVMAVGVGKKCENVTGSDWQDCWSENTNRSSCALVVNSASGEIEEESVFCNNTGNGQCRFAGKQLSCQRSLNPIQAAVDVTAKVNLAEGKRVKEVFLEPGNFTVEQKQGCVFGGPECTGFKRNVDGQIRDNVFGQGRFGVQIPSWTKLVGTMKDGDQKSVFYISKESYSAFGEAFVNGAGAKGGGVEALLMLTNVLGGADGTKATDLRLYNESMANPVKEVVISRINLLGVGGPVLKTQSTDLKPVDYYCSQPACSYRYTVLTAIVGKRIKGGGVRIESNKIEMVPAFITLGHFFNLQTPSYPQNLLGDGFVTQLRVEGETSDPIRIKDNLMDGAIAADSVIVWGDNIDITSNLIRNGFSDWYANQIAISPFTDSHNVKIIGNRIENYLTGVNLEGFAPVKGSNGLGELELMATNRVAANNLVLNNTMNNVLACVAVQRQDGSRIEGNVCTFDREKWKKLIKKSYYSPPEKYSFLTSLVGRPISQDEARDINSMIMGSAIHMRTSRNMKIVRNTFMGFPRGLLMENLETLTGGMQNNLIAQNNFLLSGVEAQEDIALITEEGVMDSYKSVYWQPGGYKVANENKFCSDNVWQYPEVTGRTYSDPSYPGQEKQATCEIIPTLTPTSVPTNSPMPTKIVTTGDFNGDGKVDLVDFAIWKNNYLAGKATLVDFVVWKGGYLK